MDRRFTKPPYFVTPRAYFENLGYEFRSDLEFAAWFSGSVERAEEYARAAAESEEAAEQAQKTAVQRALDAEAWACGTRGGEAVPVEDPTHENNAAYYAAEMQETALQVAGRQAAMECRLDAQDTEIAAIRSQAASPFDFAQTPADFADTTHAYVLVGPTVTVDGTTYEHGAWYYYADSAWIKGGMQVDDTLTLPGVAADAEVTGVAISNTSSALFKYNSVNLIPIRNDSGDDNGIVYISLLDGSYAVSGTATSSSYYRIFDSEDSLPSGMIAGQDYDLKFNGNNVAFIQFYARESSGWQSSAFLITNRNARLRIPESAVGLRIRFNVPSGTVINTPVTLEPVVMSSKSNDELENLYVNVRADVDDVQIVARRNSSEINGFNFHDLIPSATDDLVTNGITFTPLGGNVYAVNGTATDNAYFNLLSSSAPIPVGLEPGTARTLMFESDGTVKFQIYMLRNGSLSAFLSESESGAYVFTVPSDATGALIRLRVDSGTTVNDARVSLSLRSSNLHHYITPRKYVAFGDSITVGAVWSPTAGTAAHRVKREWTLPARIALATGMVNAFENRAVGGAGYITKVNGENIVDIIKAFDFSNVELVTVMGGGNDKLKAAISLGTSAATAGDGTICGAIKEIIDWFRTNHPKIQLIFIQPTPSGIPTGSDNWSTSGAGGWSMNDFDTQVSLLCHKNHVGYCNWWECTYCDTWNIRNIGYSGNVGPNYTHPVVDFDYCILGDFIAGKVSALYHSYT